VDTAGNVYVTDYWKPPGAQTAGGGQNTAVELPFTGLSHPEAVAVDTAGNVYVADYGKLPGASSYQAGYTPTSGANRRRRPMTPENRHGCTKKPLRNRYRIGNLGTGESGSHGGARCGAHPSMVRGRAGRKLCGPGRDEGIARCQKWDGPARPISLVPVNSTPRAVGRGPDDRAWGLEGAV